MRKDRGAGLGAVAVAWGVCGLLLLGGARAALADGDPPVLRVVVLGDQTGVRGGRTLDQSYETLAQAVAVANKLSPDVVLHTGDLIESQPAAADNQSVEARFKQGAGLLGKLTPPWFLTAGDHDVDPAVFKPNSPDRTAETRFHDLLLQAYPALGPRLYYSADVKGLHVVALYSQEALHTDPRWGDIYLARISDQQLAWLDDDLSKHGAAQATVVFLHQPLWYNWAGWKRVHEVLRKHHVSVVVAGHFHYGQDEGLLDGIRYVIVGATGASTAPTNLVGGGNPQLLEIELGNSVQVHPVDVATGTPFAFAPRSDMDRLHAIDVMLSGAQAVISSPMVWDQANAAPIYLKGGRLLSSCQDGAPPAVLQVVPVGNPTDTPVSVHITAQGTRAVQVESPRFEEDCLKASAAEDCVLEAGARVAVANDSSVQTYSPHALWQAELRVIDAEHLGTETPLGLGLSISFAGEAASYSVTYQIAVPIHACGP